MALHARLPKVNPLSKYLIQLFSVRLCVSEVAFANESITTKTQRLHREKCCNAS